MEHGWQEKPTYEELEEQLYCLQEILQHINEGVILTDKNYIIREFNPAKERMEQISASAALGKLSWVPYRFSNETLSEHKQVFDHGTPIIDAYRPHAYVGDVPVYIYYSTYPVIRDGKTLGVFTISRNESILRELLYETIEHKRLLRKLGDDKPLHKKLAAGTQYNFSSIVGSSRAMEQLIWDAQTVAPLNMPILITGETGTGKEVLAQSIHNMGREDKPFVAINCAAIPENLVESILFGTVKGAYTGAVGSEGLFRAAADGTLFLDEINSMSTLMQAKLLRALQEQCIRPVGSAKEYPIKCRLISASNEMPEVLIGEKRLRQDLFYRLSSFCLTIPPLRFRKNDALEMAHFFMHQYNDTFSKNTQQFTPALERWILAQDWPGNARELQNLMQNMILRASDLCEELDLSDLPEYLKGIGQPNLDTTSAAAPATPPAPPARDLNQALDQLQRDMIARSLQANGYNISKTALALGLGRQNLSARMKRLGIATHQ